MEGHVHVWEFQVRPGHEAEFERHYGPEGSWARLFRTAEGYGGTVLLRDTEHPGRYVTLDHWRDERAYQVFRAARAREYASLDAECEALTITERALGRLDVVAPRAA
jgi:heme-degrading monooxygenase HmoA